MAAESPKIWGVKPTAGRAKRHNNDTGPSLVGFMGEMVAGQGLSPMKERAVQEEGEVDSREKPMTLIRH